MRRLGSLSPSEASSIELRRSSNGKPRPRPLSLPGWKKAPWSPVLFSAAISPNFPPSLLPAASTSSPPDILANHTLQQEQEQVSRTIELWERTGRARSITCSESLEQSDLPLFSSRTSGKPSSIFDRSAENWKAWDMRLRRHSELVLSTLALRTEGNACSSWPTARGADAHGAGYMIQKDGSRLPCLGDATRNWPTPNTNPEAPNMSTKREGGKHRNRLTEQCLGRLSRQWHTPAAAHHTGAHGGKMVRDLRTDVAKWPTPEANSKGPVTRKTPGRPTTADAAEKWPTPGANDQKGSTRSGQRRRQLDEAAEQIHTHLSCSLPAPTIQAGRKSSKAGPGSRRRLNQAFVCWLMGWPIHWTMAVPIRSGREETELWRLRALSHLNSIFGNY